MLGAKIPVRGGKRQLYPVYIAYRLVVFIIGNGDKGGKGEVRLFIGQKNRGAGQVLPQHNAFFFKREAGYAGQGGICTAFFEKIPNKNVLKVILKSYQFFIEIIRKI